MSDCSDIWIDGDTLFAGIAALAAGGAYLLYRAAGGTAIRKKRVASITFMEKLQSIILIGNI